MRWKCSLWYRIHTCITVYVLMCGCMCLQMLLALFLLSLSLSIFCIELERYSKTGIPACHSLAAGLCSLNIFPILRDFLERHAEIIQTCPWETRVLWPHPRALWFESTQQAVRDFACPCLRNSILSTIYSSPGKQMNGFKTRLVGHGNIQPALDIEVGGPWVWGQAT